MGLRCFFKYYLYGTLYDKFNKVFLRNNVMNHQIYYSPSYIKIDLQGFVSNQYTRLYRLLTLTPILPPLTLFLREFPRRLLNLDSIYF